MNKLAPIFLSVLIGTAVSFPHAEQRGGNERFVEPIPRAEMVEYITERYLAEHNVEEVVEVPEEIFLYYDIPLDHDLQQYIYNQSTAHNIDPELIFAMIAKESTYQVDLLGDNGKSYGLMQIQPRWHEERMNRLGCTDLLDAYQNVTVGIDIVAELFDKYGDDTNYVLMCYNGGENYAHLLKSKGMTSTLYVNEVLRLKKEIHGKQQCYD